MKNVVLKYGIAAGVLMTLVFFFSSLAAGDPPDFAMQELLGYIGIFLSMLAIFFGIKRFRDDTPGGRIRFGKAVSLGLGIAAVAGVMIGLYTIAHIAWLDPDYSAKYSEWSRQQVLAQNMPAEEQAAAIEQINSMEKFMESSLMQGLVMFATVFVIGAVIALICAAILQRAGPARQTAEQV